MPVDDQKVRRPDISKAKEVLGWKPKTPINIGIEKKVKWFKVRVGNFNLNSQLTSV